MAGIDAPSTDLTQRIKARRLEMARSGELNGDRNPNVQVGSGRAFDVSQADALSRAHAARESRAARSSTVVDFQYTPEEREALGMEPLEGDDEPIEDLGREEEDFFDLEDADDDEDAAPPVEARAPRPARGGSGVEPEVILDLLARIEPYLAAYEKIEERLNEIDRVLAGHGQGLILLGKGVAALAVPEPDAEPEPETMAAPEPEPKPKPRPWWSWLVSGGSGPYE